MKNFAKYGALVCFLVAFLSAWAACWSSGAEATAVARQAAVFGIAGALLMVADV